MLLVQDLGNTLVCNVGYQILDIAIYCSSWNSGMVSENGYSRAGK